MTGIVAPYAPVAEDIEAVGKRLRSLAAGHHPLLGETLAYVFETSGKRIRPALVMLSGMLGTYHRDRLITLAASLEVVHTASLVHDDTIDESISRRGLETVNAVWDSKVAILVGDFLLAQSAELASQLNSVPIMSMLSETVMAMTSGELRQYASTRARSLDEADYFHRIAGKTASLFAMCCAGAGVVSEQAPACVDALRLYGMNLGLAFQIADDVLDFTGDETVLGKPAGGDLRQGTITLPVILWAQDQPGGSAKLDMLPSNLEVASVIEAVRDSDAPAKALSRAEEYARRARAELGAFPSTDARDSLLQLTEDAIRRRS